MALPILPSSSSLTAAMGALATWEIASVIPVLSEAAGASVKHSRYRPRTPNVPGLWHERRPGVGTAQDTAVDRAEIFLAVVLAVRHTDDDRESVPLELMFDHARALYEVECKRRQPFGIHHARLTNFEPPTPTVINDVPVLTAGLVLRLRIDAIRLQPS